MAKIKVQPPLLYHIPKEEGEEVFQEVQVLMLIWYLNKFTLAD